MSSPSFAQILEQFRKAQQPRQEDAEAQPPHDGQDTDQEMKEGSDQQPSAADGTAEPAPAILVPQLSPLQEAVEGLDPTPSSPRAAGVIDLTEDISPQSNHVNKPGFVITRRLPKRLLSGLRSAPARPLTLIGPAEPGSNNELPSWGSMAVAHHDLPNKTITTSCNPGSSISEAAPKHPSSHASAVITSASNYSLQPPTSLAGSSLGIMGAPGQLISAPGSLGPQPAVDRSAVGAWQSALEELQRGMTAQRVPMNVHWNAGQLIPAATPAQLAATSGQIMGSQLAPSWTAGLTGPATSHAQLTSQGLSGSDVVDLTDDTADAEASTDAGHQSDAAQQRMLPSSLMQQLGIKRRSPSPLPGQPPFKRLPNDLRQPLAFPSAQPLSALLRGGYAGVNGQDYYLQPVHPEAHRALDPGALSLPPPLLAAQRRMPPALAPTSASAQPATSVDALQTMRALVEGMQSTGDEQREPPAKSLAVSMMPHQKLALAWMCKREECRRPCGGVLADDQGLGKTVTTIALMLTNPPEHHATNKAKSQQQQDGSGVSSDALSDSSDSLEEAEGAYGQTGANGEAASAAPAVPPGSQEPPASSSGNADSAGPSMGGPGPGPGPGSVFDMAAAAEKAAAAAAMAAGGVFTGGPEQPPRVASTSGGPPGNGAIGGSDGNCGRGRARGSGEEPGPSGSGSSPQQRGGTLVVCPTSVLHQWAREIGAKVSKHTGFSVYIYHGKDKDVTAASLCRYSAVLTTYGSMALEAPARERLNLKIKKQGTANVPIDLCELDSDGEGAAAAKASKGKGKSKRNASGGPLYEVLWHRVVLDEAQAIKNARTLAAHAAWALHAERRWCLSGTPIQNSVDDLFPLFRFLRYEPFSSARTFKDQVKDAINANPQIGFKRLQAILQPILLRRTKTTKINGQPIVSIPPREQQLLKKEFSSEEARLYAQVQAESKAQLQALSGSGGSAYVNMLHSLLRLRQACNHPWLVKGTSFQASKSGTPSASELSSARRVPEARRAQLLAMAGGADGSCPACGDVAEEPLVAPCSHVYCRQCVVAQLEGGDAAEFLCSACGVLLRQAELLSVAALQAVQEPGSNGTAAGSSGGSSQRPWVSSSKIDALLEVLEAVRVRNGAGVPRPLQTDANPLAAKSRTSAALAAAAFRRPPPAQSQAPAARIGRPEKVIVFSQWTSMLDLLEIPLKKGHYVYRRLDGTMSIQQRERAIQDFESSVDVLVLIVSLKAAALGVNLTSANHVVLLDLWWNPTTEEQAIDRAHRIGQTRTVHVTRITVRGTVEERILELQEKKRQLVAAALTEGREAGGDAMRLSLEDLRFLFQGVF